MTNEEAIAIIRREYLCVSRDCDIEKSCGRCDLMMPRKEPLLEAYKMAMDALEKEPCEDAISRQAVNNLQKYRYNCGDTSITCISLKSVNELPPVNPQESCEDAINRQALLDAFGFSEKTRKWGGDHSGYNTMMLYEIQDMIESAPSVKPQEKTGHWIEHPEIETSTPEYLMFYECSECGDKQCFCKSDIHKKHFCNNCGARMVEPQERSDKE